MEKILAGIDRTKNFIGKTVKEQNPNILLDFFKNKGKTIGVKDTKEIDNNLIKKLLRNGYIWNTIDFSSDRGRAIDIRLLNPITSKVMTGSSSGTAINVLYGLNTVGIGTDGGGSVLGPAISLNLYSALLSGMGLKGKNKKKSTDEIAFIAGIGFITQNFMELEKVLKIFYEESEKKLKKLVLSDTLEKEIGDKLKNNYEITIWKDKSLFSREELMTELNNIFQKGDVFIYIEKNIEVEGYDYRSFKYLKENNEIISMNFKCFTPTLGSNLKKNTVTYKIEDNQLKIINSIIKKEDTYYIYDEFGSYKELPKEDRNIYEYKVNGKLYLFNEKNGTNGNTIEIYDNNLNKLWIITGLTDTYARYVVNTNNTTTFNAEKDGVFVIFDSNMNLIHESKNYEIVGIVSDYVIVIKNGKARILDLEENEVTVFNELPSNYAHDIYYLDNNNITFRIKDNSTGNYWVYKYNLETKERNIEKK